MYGIIFLVGTRIPHRGIKSSRFVREIETRIGNFSEGLEIFQTRSMGRGVKTTRKFPKGSVVTEYTGTLLRSRKEFLERERVYLNDPNLAPGGYIFGFHLRGREYWLVFLNFFDRNFIIICKKIMNEI